MLFNIFGCNDEWSPEIIGFVKTIECEDSRGAIHEALVKVINAYLIADNLSYALSNTLCLFGHELFIDFIDQEAMDDIFVGQVVAFIYVKVNGNYPVIFAASKVTTE